MRSRLSLFLNDLTLEEIIFFETELDRRKEKYRRQFSVLAVHTDRPILKPDSGNELTGFVKDVRRYFTSSVAAGGGTVLAFAPDASLALFHKVSDAAKCVSALMSGLTELNGKQSSGNPPIGLKLGLASGVDTLAPGSPRSVRASVLVRRANQAAWRSNPNQLLMDENSYQEFPERSRAVRAAIEIDGQPAFQLSPGLENHKEVERYDNTALLSFIRQVEKDGNGTVKYDMVSQSGNPERSVAWGKPVQAVRLFLESYIPHTKNNAQYSEVIATTQFAERMEIIRHLLGNAGLSLVRHDLFASDRA